MEDGSVIVKVSKSSRVAGVAGAIAAIVREKGYAIVQSIGTVSTDRSVLATALAFQYLYEDGKVPIMVPGIFSIKSGAGCIKGVRFLVWTANTTLELESAMSEFCKEKVL